MEVLVPKFTRRRSTPTARQVVSGAVGRRFASAPLSKYLIRKSYRPAIKAEEEGIKDEPIARLGELGASAMRGFGPLAARYYITDRTSIQNRQRSTKRDRTCGRGNPARGFCRTNWVRFLLQLRRATHYWSVISHSGHMTLTYATAFIRKKEDQAPTTFENREVRQTRQAARYDAYPLYCGGRYGDRLYFVSDIDLSQSKRREFRTVSFAPYPFGGANFRYIAHIAQIKGGREKRYGAVR